MIGRVATIIQMAVPQVYCKSHVGRSETACFGDIHDKISCGHCDDRAVVVLLDDYATYSE